MTTPTPSDAAMAAAYAVENYATEGANYHQKALIIDKAFAPLREELAETKYVAQSLDNLYVASQQENTTLRASNDKLRAALEAWAPIEYEIFRRAEKEHAEADYCNFTVTIQIDEFIALTEALSVARAAVPPPSPPSERRRHEHQ